MKFVSWEDLVRSVNSYDHWPTEILWGGVSDQRDNANWQGLDEEMRRGFMAGRDWQPCGREAGEANDMPRFRYLRHSEERSVITTSDQGDSSPLEFPLPDAAAVEPPPPVSAGGDSASAMSDSLAASQGDIPVSLPGAVLFFRDLTYAELSYFHVITPIPLDGSLPGTSSCYQPLYPGRYTGVAGFYYWPRKWQWFKMPPDSEVTIYKDPTGAVSAKVEKYEGSLPAWVSVSEDRPTCGWPWAG